MQGPYIGRMSPLVQQLNNESGYSNIYGGFLPRPPQTFTDGAFSPFSPIMPVPIDAPPPGYERPEPRRFQYEVGYNLPVGDPGTEAGYKLAPFATLKSLSKTYSIARRCIQLVKKEVCGLEWDITMTSHAEKAYQGDRGAQRDFGERRAQAMRFFKKPDPNYFNFTSWLSVMLEQVLVTDALSLYMCPKKGTGLHRGLLGSNLDSLWNIDGATIRPLLALHGGMPMPPAPAFQQYEFGVPRADFTTVMAGLDLPELAGGERGAYRGDQLMYLPMTLFPDSPYGMSPTEQAIVPILTGLRKQGYQLEFFTEGTVPAVYISPGDTSMTPNQIRELQDSLNAVANDQAFHWKVIVLPAGSKTQPMKPNDIVDQSDEWIANEVCMMYGVSPMDVGILPKVSTVASPFAAREMAQASRTTQEKTDTKPLLNFMAAIPNFILQVLCDQQDMEFAFEGQREIQDEAALTDTYVKQAQIGVRSVDEFRDKIGLPPWGLPESSGPVVFTPMGPIPLADAVQIASATAQQKALPPGQSSGGKKPAASAKPSPSMTNAGRQRARGGAALTPAHAASEGFMPERAPKKPSAGPAHPQASVKASLAELEALTRHLRKGREITTWEPRHLEPRALALIAEQMARGLDAEQAAGIVKTVVLPPASYAWVEKAQSPQAQAQAQQQALAQQYAARIRAAFGTAAAAAARLILAWGAGTLAVTAAVLAVMVADLIRKALQEALTALWEDAWHHGEGEAGGSDAAGLEAFLATWGRQVQEWVSDTLTDEIAAALHDLAGLKRKALIARLLEMLQAEERSALIALTEVMRAWNAAVAAVWKMLGIAYKGWQTRNDAKVCASCRANQAAGFIPLDAVFPSGDRMPPGHPRCRCYPIPPPPDWRPPAANKKRKRGVNLDGEVVIADADPEDENPAGGGGRTLYPHRGDGTEVPGGVPGASAGGEPPRWDASTPERRGYVNEYGEDDAEWPDRDRVAPPRPDEDYPDGGDEDEDSWPEGGTGSAQAPATSIGDGPRGRPPNGVGKAADAAARFLADAPKAKASAVRKLMLENFPPDALEWVGRARWVGPVEIPLELMDLSGRKGWAASHQTGHVKAIARDLKAGKHVNEIIGVLRPGHNHVRLVDGRHRTLACEKAGYPVRAYVGFLDRDSDLEAAYDTYHQQFHSGDNPENK
jgi:hypothetical protein